MPIRNRRALFAAADESLSRHGSALQGLLLIYLALVTGLSLLAAGLTVALSNRIAGTGGLSGMGLRSILSTAQSVLPMVQTALLAGLQLGYCHAALNARRDLPFSRETLLGGFRRVIPLLAAYILQGLIYAFLALVSMYFATYIFLMLPASAEFQALMTPLISSVTVLDSQLVLDESTLLAAGEAVMPVLWIFLLVFLPLFLPAHYRYRMTIFRLLDQDVPRPMLALRESRMMLHRSRLALLKLDLQLWWYYALQILVMAVCYGDQLLPLLGITLPWSYDVSYFLFLTLSLALQAAVFYLFMNRVTLVYAASYQELLASFEETKTRLMEKLNTASRSPRTPWRDPE